MTKIIFSLPDFFQASYFNTYFLHLFKTKRQWFYDDVEIGSVYGSFPCIWNGGRFINGAFNMELIEHIMVAFAEYGIEMRHTFTNPYINRVNINDILGNAILRLASGKRFKSAVNVNSPIMYAYIEKNYPKIGKIWSTTLGISEIQQINFLSKKDMLVLNYRLNNRFEILEQLKHKHNIEILVGEACIDNCPKRQEHYSDIAKQQMWMMTSNFRCPYSRESILFQSKDPEGELKKLKHFIGIDEIRNIYAPMGFTNFKISGRKESYKALILRYTMYLAKPTYKRIVQDDLMQMASTMPQFFIPDNR